jgi:cytochrome P450
VRHEDAAVDRAGFGQEDVVPEDTVSVDAAVLDPDVTTTPDDPVSDYDDRRSRCPVSRDAAGTWTLYRHDDVRAAALDDVTFSNATSRFLKVPNGLDGDEHTAFRSLVDRYFTADRLAALRPAVVGVADEVVDEAIEAAGGLPARVDAVSLGARFAVRTSCAWLGWPCALEAELLDWMAANRAATRSGDLGRTAEVAARFDRIVRTQVVERREAARRSSSDVTGDVTAELVADTFLGRRLTDQEITSILRNWTGGDLDSVALCAGVVLAYLADHRRLQARLRSGVSEHEFDAVIDETLRIDNPFVANRRVVTTDTVVGAQPIARGERVALNWTAANRDPEVFGDPDRFDPKRNAPHNLVYGIGRHACPGRGLATMELRLLTQAVLARTVAVTPDPDDVRARSQPPSGGYSRVPLLLR